MMFSSIAFSQITGIDREQKQILVKALTNYDNIKVELKLTQEKLSLTELELAYREEQYDNLIQQIDNNKKMLSLQSEVIENQKEIIKKKSRIIKPVGIGLSIGFIIGLLISK